MIVNKKFKTRFNNNHKNIMKKKTEKNKMNENKNNHLLLPLRESVKKYGLFLNCIQTQSLDSITKTNIKTQSGIDD